MKKLIILIFFFQFIISFAQEQQTADSIDIHYLEDQLYLNFTYNILANKPSGIKQNGFSGGLGLGFIKDFPINKKRNIGVGLGIGYSYDVLIHNMKIDNTSNITEFSEVTGYDKNNLILNSIDFPIELRFRNSTPTKYKFWRVYTGVKMSYITSATTNYKDAEQQIKTKNISEIDRFQYGITLAIGYGTWNLYIYNSLTPLFSDSYLDGNKIDIKNFNVGLRFYIM